MSIKYAREVHLFVNLFQYSQKMSQYKATVHVKAISVKTTHLFPENNCRVRCYKSGLVFISTLANHNLPLTKYHITNHLSTIKKMLVAAIPTQN